MTANIERPAIILIDIDATLVDTSGAGRRAMTQAFFEITGRRDIGEFSFAGLTDRAIVRRALQAAARPTEVQHIDQVMNTYLALLEGQLANTDYRVLPGVAELVARLGEDPEVAMGLGTGNVVAGAERKLGPGDLMRHFSFGGFGSDSEDRPELIGVGLGRGAQALKLPLERCARWVIGDTPLDVDAALKNDARSVGVASGIFTVEQLVEAGATLAVDSLADQRVFRALSIER